MQIPFDSQVMADSARISIVTLVIFAALAILSFPLAKSLRVSKTKQYLIMFMLLFGNTGFIGLPVIKALYGTDALFYAAIVEVINDILLFTVGIMLIQLSAGAKLRMDPKQIISPGLVGVFIGLILFLLNIQLPEVIASPIAMVGNATTPQTMFVIGGQLASLKLKEIAGDWKVYGVIFIRLLVIPLIALAIVRLCMGEFTLLEKVIVISFAMPAAAASAIFSQQYKGEEAFATKSVLMTTVCSILTIPVFAIIMEL
jgi:predicted permease